MSIPITYTSKCVSIFQISGSASLYYVVKVAFSLQIFSNNLQEKAHIDIAEWFPVWKPEAGVERKGEEEDPDDPAQRDAHPQVRHSHS